MSWTPPVAIFFGCIALLLAVMTVLEIRWPTVARRGWLPMVTTRGDRLFIGLLIVAYANLAWAGFTELPQWLGAAGSSLLLAATLKWG